MATVNEKQPDGSYTLKYVPDAPASTPSPVPSPAGPGITTPNSGAALTSQAPSGANAAGTPGTWVTNPQTGINEFQAAGAPISRTVTPDPAQSYLDTFQAPQTAAQIAEQKRKDAQALIDATNAQYDTQVASERTAGQDRLNKNNSISVLSGLSGSTEAVRTDNTVSAANQKAIDAVNAQRAVALQGIYSKISADAETEARAQKEDAYRSANDIITRRKESTTQTLSDLKQMASGGLVDFEQFKNNPQNAQVYQHALDAAGGSEDALRAIFALNRPQDQIVGSPTRVGNKYMQAYKNPVTGKVSFETLDLPMDIPPNYTTFQKIGDSKSGESLIAIPDNWNGDMSQVKTVASTHPASTSGTSSSGLSPLAQSVFDNPELFNQITPTQKAAIAPELARSGFNAFGKPLSDTAITAINQTDFALTSLNDLRAKIQGNTDKLGPIMGFAALNPYSDARQLQADVDRVRQTVGKALEGGVLRKEDEEKYKKILATLNDTPDTAIYKIDELIKSITKNLADYKDLQKTAGKSDLSAPKSSDADPLGLGI